ncbi:putative ankyrin repeat-containing domain superfamily [Septoria linicola]|nr:putative ankyrin repeat-containing domain superfamily [Septoria linicola]
MDLADHLLGALLVLICVTSLAFLVLEAQHARIGTELKSGVRKLGKVAVEAAPNGMSRKSRESDTNDIAIREKQMVAAPPLTPLPLVRANTSTGNYITWASLSLFVLWTATIYPVSVKLRQASVATGDSTLQPLPSLNPDIAGDGIRAGLYVPVSLSLVAIVHGYFHCSNGGMKEQGIAHLVSKYGKIDASLHVLDATKDLASLLVNTAKAILSCSLSQLSIEERLIAAISIDIASNGVRVSLSDKTTLASRHFVWISITLRSFGIFCIIALVHSIREFQHHRQSYQIYWYGPINASYGASWPVWLVVAMRTISCIHDLLSLAWKQTFALDLGRKKAQNNRLYAQYHALPASVLSRHLECWPVIAVDVWTLEMLIRGRDHGKLSDWGQSAALIIALTSALHWIFVVVNLSCARRRHRTFSRYWPAFAHSIDQPLKQLTFWQSEATGKSKLYWQDQLMEACRRSDANLLSYAMEHLDDMYASFVDADHNTPRLLCVSRGNIEMAKTLKDVYRVTSTFPLTSSAVSSAAEHGEAEILRYLLLDSADTSDNPRAPDRDGNSPLMLACRGGHWQATKILLQDSRVFNDNLVQEPNGPLWSAIRSSNPHSTCTAALLLDFLEQTQQAGHIFVTLVQFNQDGDLEGIRKMNDLAGAPSSTVGPDSWSALHYTATKDNAEVMQEVLHYVPDSLIDLMNNEGETALSIALQRGHNELALMLLNHPSSADPGLIDVDGRSAMSLACDHGHLGLIKLLLQLGVIHNSHDHVGRTPLSYAAEGLHDNTVELLLLHGADPFAMDKLYMLPVAYTSARGQGTWITEDTPDVKWPNGIKEHWAPGHYMRNIQITFARYMPTTTCEDRLKWIGCLGEATGRPGGLQSDMKECIAWFCQKAALNPTNASWSYSEPRGHPDEPIFPDSLIHIVVDKRLKGLISSLNEFKVKVFYVEDSLAPVNDLPCAIAYMIRVIQYRVDSDHIPHLPFIVEEADSDVNAFESLILGVAVYSQLVANVEYLLSRGSLTEGICWSATGVDRCTPLSSAAGVPAGLHVGKEEIISLLLEHGAEVNPDPDAMGPRPLDQAVAALDCDLVEKLLKLGADVNYCRLAQPRTALDLAALRLSRIRHREAQPHSDLDEAYFRLESEGNRRAFEQDKLHARTIIEMLIQHGARFSRWYPLVSSDDATDMEVLVQTNERAVCQLLIDAGACIAIKTSKSKARNAHDILLGELVDKGVSLLYTSKNPSYDHLFGVRWGAPWAFVVAGKVQRIRTFEKAVYTLWNRLDRTHEGKVAHFRARIGEIDEVDAERLIVEAGLEIEKGEA